MVNATWAKMVMGACAAQLVLWSAAEQSGKRLAWGDALGAQSTGQENVATRAHDATRSYAVADPTSLINQEISRVWTEYGLRPSPEAPDGPWCRRVFLDILGRIPTTDELDRFLRDKDKDKRSKLVDRLLGDEYVDAYSQNWATIWTNILIGRSGGNQRNSLTNRRGLRDYLRGSFAENKPYDRMVYELITARGANAPGQSDFNGAVNFLVGKLDASAVEATAETAKIFLGLQVQCTQCHNHPFNSWKQNQFWELNAFFRQTAALRRFVPGTNDIRYVELANQDFGGEGLQMTPEEAEIYYELRNGILKAAYPVFVDGKSRPELKSGYLSDVDRREELGKLIIQSPRMSQASVNRMWAHFLGYGFTKPIDDMGPHNPPSHPELLGSLAERFRYDGFNLKRLIRWIVLSQPYQRSSKITPSAESDDPTLGESPKFSHFYLRQMRAEELYESLLVATWAHKARRDQTREQQDETRQEWLRQFIIAFGTDEGDETTTFNGSIPQTLMMFNGDLMKRATGAGPGSFLSQIAHSDKRPAEKIESLFLASLARRPTRREIDGASQLWAAHGGNMMFALQDLWWALLNSNEFILNH